MTGINGAIGAAAVDVVYVVGLPFASVVDTVTGISGAISRASVDVMYVVGLPFASVVEMVTGINGAIGGTTVDIVYVVGLPFASVVDTVMGTNGAVEGIAVVVVYVFGFPFASVVNTVVRMNPPRAPLAAPSFAAAPLAPSTLAASGAFLCSLKVPVGAAGAFGAPRAELLGGVPGDVDETCTFTLAATELAWVAADDASVNRGPPKEASLCMLAEGVGKCPSPEFDLMDEPTCDWALAKMDEASGAAQCVQMVEVEVIRTVDKMVVTCGVGLAPEGVIVVVTGQELTVVMTLKHLLDVIFSSRKACTYTSVDMADWVIHGGIVFLEVME